MASPLKDSDDLEITWEENPHVLRAYIESRDQYEQLCREIAYILEKRLRQAKVEYSAVTNRAKTLKSFAEKILRKSYEEPLKDIKDLAGVRIVFLYKSDLPLIEQIVELEFDVIEKVDKVGEKETDRFGYGALHYLVRLGSRSSGARYDDLSGLVCEIQIRTVLQDAWAVIAHHLSYKQESDVPKVLQRKLNVFSALFENADDQFDHARAEWETYKKEVKRKLSSTREFLKEEANLDTFTEFLRWKFPSLKVSRGFEHISRVLATAKQYGYKRLDDLDRLTERTKMARQEMNKKKPNLSGAGEVARAIAFEQEQYRSEWNDTKQKLFRKFENLLSDREKQVQDNAPR